MVEQGEGLSIEKSVAARRKRRECDLYRKLKKAQDAWKTESKELSVQKSGRSEWTRSQQDLAGYCTCPLSSGKVLRGLKGRGKGTMENTGPIYISTQ